MPDSEFPDPTNTGENASAFWPGDGLGAVDAAALHAFWQGQAQRPGPRHLPMRFSGRFDAAGKAGERLELRIDVDGPDSTRCVSADHFASSGAVTSFVLLAFSLTVRADGLLIEGSARFSAVVKNPKLSLFLPKPATGQRAQSATLRFLGTDGVVTGEWDCRFASRFFRELAIENDQIANSPAMRLGTASTARPTEVRTVRDALDWAGVSVRSGGTPHLINGTGGPTAPWSDRDLFAAVDSFFDLGRARTPWSTYVLSGTTYFRPGYRGLMFDTAARRGCAVFHITAARDDIGEQEAGRGLLRTYVHEIGHCLNLLHCGESGSNTSLASHSWMGVPGAFKGASGAGAAAYWQGFDRRFDPAELLFVRHDFRNTVMPGGGVYRGGLSGDRVVMQSLGAISQIEGVVPGLFSVRCSPWLLLGAPVVLELKLHRGLHGAVPDALHPRLGRTRVHVEGPDAVVREFRPLSVGCADLVAPRRLRVSAHDAVYIGYGADGFLFDWPGRYRIVATHVLPDGRVLVSNRATVRIAAPRDREEEGLCASLLDEGQGQLFAVLGSDAPKLQRAREQVLALIDRAPDHRLAGYGRLLEGMCSAAPFHSIDHRKRALIERRARPDAAIAHLSPLTDAILQSADADALPLLDNQSAAMVAVELGRSLSAADRAHQARQLGTRFALYLHKRRVPARICKRVGRAIAVGARISAETGKSMKQGKETSDE